MHKLKKLFLEELKRYENEDEVTPEMLETVHLLTDTVKNICKIDKLMLEDEEGGYSRGEGKEGMVEYLEEMMMDAKSPKEKEAIRKCISEIRGA